MKSSLNFAMILLATIFSNFVFAAPLSPISNQELQARIAILTQAPYHGGAVLKYKTEEAGCAIFSLAYPVKDPFSDAILTYEMKFSWPHSETPVPVILTVPTIEGVTVMEGSVLKQMCKMKVAAIIAHVNNEGIQATPEGVLLADHQLMRGAVALRSLLDVLEDLPAVEGSSSISRVLVDPKRVGLVGLSVGSISSLLAMAVDTRFKGLFIMGAIGNSPHALAFSDNTKVKNLRNVQMKHLGLSSQEEYEMYLRTQMKATPVEYASLLAKRNIYQVIIENDIIAPTEGQYEIKSSTGNAKTYVDRGTFGHGVALAGEIVVNQMHLPNFVRTEIK
jgi:hypothetical protein